MEHGLYNLENFFGGKILDITKGVLREVYL